MLQPERPITFRYFLPWTNFLHTVLINLFHLRRDKPPPLRCPHRRRPQRPAPLLSNYITNWFADGDLVIYNLLHRDHVQIPPPIPYNLVASWSSGMEHIYTIPFSLQLKRRRRIISRQTARSWHSTTLRSPENGSTSRLTALKNNNLYNLCTATRAATCSGRVMLSTRMRWNSLSLTYHLKV